MRNLMACFSRFPVVNAGAIAALLFAADAHALSVDPMGVVSVSRAVSAACTAEGADCTGIVAGSVSVHATTDADIRHYEFVVDLADGTEIGIHRVVRVTGAPGPIPVASDHGVMLAHGDVWSFQPAFMARDHSVTPAAVLPDSLPMMLARQGFDVWGIDFGWTRLRAGDDTSILAGWGVDRDARDLTLAMSIARELRAVAGNRLHLIGWSRGAITGYAAVSLESSRPVAMRNVRTFIPVDVYVESPLAAQRAKACARLAANQALIASGVHANDSTLIAALGQLALADPTGASPVLAGFSNAQAANFVGAATYALLAPNEPTPSYHLFAGTWEASVPVGLQYTEETRAYHVMAAAAPYEPLQLLADSDAATCDDPSTDVAFDDRLSRIRVPLLYVGAAGGFGASGVFTAQHASSLINSAHVVQLEATADSLVDVGHADIFNASAAHGLFWGPMRDFMLAH